MVYTLEEAPYFLLLFLPRPARKTIITYKAQRKYKTRRKETTVLKKFIMNREITELTAIIFANLLDVIPLISNTDDSVDSILLNIYYRNAAYFQDMNQEVLIEHPEENNFIE